LEHSMGGGKKKKKKKKNQKIIIYIATKVTPNHQIKCKGNCGTE
jgi:hypothetical protein